MITLVNDQVPLIFDWLFDRGPVQAMKTRPNIRKVNFIWWSPFSVILRFVLK